RVRARRAEAGAAAKVDAGHRFDVERARVRELAAHQPLIAVADAQHRNARQTSANGSGADHAVDTGSGAAADHDRELISICHAERPKLFGPRAAAKCRFSAAPGGVEHAVQSYSSAPTADSEPLC